MKGKSPAKDLQKAQAERQHQGEVARAALDQFAEVLMANGERFPEDGPLLAIDAWAEWTQTPASWRDCREALIDLAGSAADADLLARIFPEDGPNASCVEILKLADQLAYNRQLAEAAARWRKIQKDIPR